MDAFIYESVGLTFVYDVHDNHILPICMPFFRPKQTLYVIPDLEIAECIVLLDVFETYQHSWELFDAVHLTFPNRKLLSYWTNTLLIAESKTRANWEVDIVMICFLVSDAFLSVK